MVTRLAIRLAADVQHDPFLSTRENAGKRSYKITAVISPSLNTDRRVISRMCVAILTGYPDTDRKSYVTRLLGQLRSRVIPPDAGSAKYDLHLFCEGHCTAAMFNEPDVNNITIPAPYNIYYHSLYGAVHSSTQQSRDVPVSTDRQRLLRRFSAMFRPRLDSVKDETYFKQRWFFTSKNYFSMFEILFRGISNTSFFYAHCTILEDDLVLSSDALLYLRAGERLMDHDSSIFTVSLFNDNSYPLYAHDASAFRRVSHFAGLGFVMSRARYLSDVRIVWTQHRHWDVIMQSVMARNNLSSIIPEVSRALHLRRTGKETTLDSILIPRHLFESQSLNENVLDAYDLTDIGRDEYNRYLIRFIHHGIRIKHLSNALYFDSKSMLLYTKCADQATLHKILTERSLWGYGNGKVIRGSYRGTLLLRYYDALVLLLCEDSFYYAYTKIIMPTSSFHEKLTESKPGIPSSTASRLISSSNNSTLAIAYGGIVYRLQKEYDILVGDFNESCDRVCAKVRRRCNLRGLWLVNEHCSVIMYFMKYCKICTKTTINKYIGVLPGADCDSVCRASYPHYISCATYSFLYRRLCTCL